MPSDASPMTSGAHRARIDALVVKPKSSEAACAHQGGPTAALERRGKRIDMSVLVEPPECSARTLGRPTHRCNSSYQCGVDMSARLCGRACNDGSAPTDESRSMRRTGYSSLMQTKWHAMSCITATPNLSLTPK